MKNRKKVSEMNDLEAMLWRARKRKVRIYRQHLTDKSIGRTVVAEDMKTCVFKNSFKNGLLDMNTECRYRMVRGR